MRWRNSGQACPAVPGRWWQESLQTTPWRRVGKRSTDVSGGLGNVCSLHRLAPLAEPLETGHQQHSDTSHDGQGQARAGYDEQKNRKEVSDSVYRRDHAPSRSARTLGRVRALAFRDGPRQRHRGIRAYRPSDRLLLCREGDREEGGQHRCGRRSSRNQETEQGRATCRSSEAEGAPCRTRRPSSIPHRRLAPAHFASRSERVAPGTRRRISPSCAVDATSVPSCP